MKFYITIISSAICLLILGFAGTINAQNPVNIGIKGGMNIANFTGADYDTDARTGLTAGLAVGISLPVLPFGIETGAYYSQKGAEATEDGITGTFKVDYLEIPVMAKIHMGPPSPIYPYLLVGPYLGFNMNAETEISGGGGSLSGDLDDETKGTEFGGTAGVGLNFNLGVTKLSAEARYSLGFTSVFEDDFDDGEKNAALSVTVGIWF